MQERLLEMDFSPDDRCCTLSLRGDWTLASGLYHSRQLKRSLSEKQDLQELRFDCAGLGEWDSCLMGLVREIRSFSRQHDMTLSLDGLPVGAVRLLKLSESYPSRTEMEKVPSLPPFFQRIGRQAMGILSGLDSLLIFLGNLTLALLRLLVGRARYRPQDVQIFLSDAGPGSISIVAMISFLVGMILAFVGAMQLKQFGAEIFVASLVGLGMGREMGAMMTAIIMAGRTGASYAAQIGSMQVNEEIDALKTMGLSEIEFLVLPRVIGLMVMLPLLTIVSVAMGVIGGAVVSLTMLDISWLQYVKQMSSTVPMYHFAIGLVKSLLFAVAVVMAGCINGLNSGRSATAVGQATTRAVVHSIVAIIVLDSIVNVILTLLGV